MYTSPKNLDSPRICVVIPAYRVTNQIVGVCKKIGPEVQHILVIDDACPEGSGKLVQKTVNDPRIEIIFNLSNEGVGGAVLKGYARALELCADIVIKIDGDGQMDPGSISQIIKCLT